MIRGQRLVSLPEIEEQLGRLQEFFQAAEDGSDLYWVTIETTTGIKMDTKGRALARRALHKLHRPYEALKGDGVRLSTASSALTIVRAKFQRVDGAMRSVERTQKDLQARHLEQMNQKEQREMLTLSGFFGALRAFAKSGTKALRD